MSENTVPFRLRKIATNQFATFDSVEINEGNININLNFGFGINEDNRIIGCSARFEYKSEQSTFLVLNISCDFEVETEAWNSFLKKEENAIIFPKQFCTHLGVITVGTARGILHAKTENSIFNKYLLPTIDVTQSIKNDIKLQLK